jgi:DNA-directed RNA polymerase subunit RPC12/RpoP
MLRGIRQVETIRQELRCPECGYDLHGQRGELVTCPECGFRCDIGRLISERWTGPWQMAPGYSWLLVPVGWLMIGAILTAVAHMFDKHEIGLPTRTIAVVSVSGLGWIILLWLLSRRHSVRYPIGLSLLAHGLLVGYVSTLLGLIWAIVGVFQAASNAERALWVGISLVTIPLFIICRRGERFIAEQCIRGHLRRRSGVR